MALNIKSIYNTVGPLYELAKVEKNGVHMKGIVALQRIPANTYLCSYAGTRVDATNRTAFLKSLEDAAKHEAYDMVHPIDKSKTISPVDETGTIKEEYLKEASIYFNEASKEGEFPNFRYVPNYSTQTIDLITIFEVLPGTELLGFYGEAYPRDWDIWWFENTLEDDRLQYFGGFICNEDQLETLVDVEPITVLGRNAIPGIRKVVSKRRRM